jgi:hypothetical protein
MIWRTSKKTPEKWKFLKLCRMKAWWVTGKSSTDNFSRKPLYEASRRVELGASENGENQNSIPNTWAINKQIHEHNSECMSNRWRGRGLFVNLKRARIECESSVWFWNFEKNGKVNSNFIAPVLVLRFGFWWVKKLWKMWFQ